MHFLTIEPLQRQADDAGSRVQTVIACSRSSDLCGQRRATKLSLKFIARLALNLLYMGVLSHASEAASDEHCERSADDLADQRRVRRTDYVTRSFSSCWRSILWRFIFSHSVLRLIPVRAAASATAPSRP